MATRRLVGKPYQDKDPEKTPPPTADLALAAYSSRPRPRPRVLAMVRDNPPSFQLWMRPNAGLILYVASLSLADGEAPQRWPEQTWPRPCQVGPLQQLRQGSPEG
jgi:hypothetical protein